MRQERKPEAGKYKHNNTEHPIWIFDGGTYSLVCFVLQCGRKRYLTPQLVRFSFVLDRIVHLPVPSESFSPRGKEISEIFSVDEGSTIERMGPNAERVSGRKTGEGLPEKSA
jgi:hypothetical protein